MLTSLKIKNFIIIESVTLNFSPNLSVISGETGAGKSILVNALKLVLGGRAQSDVIRHGTNEAELEASFDIRKNKQVLGLLEDNKIENNDSVLIVRRTINQSGQNKIFINDTAVTLSFLSKITQNLVDICSQFENQSLFSSWYQLSLLDKFSNNSDQLKEFELVYREIVEIEKELKRLSLLDSEREKKLDYFLYQYDEINSINPDVDEDSKIEEELSSLSKSKELYEVIKQIENSFYSDDSSVVSKIESIKSKLVKIGLPSIKEYEKKISQLVDLAEEFSSGIIAHKKQIKFKPERVSELSNRLDSIRKLKRKYGGSLSSVLNKRDELKSDIDKMQNLEEEKSNLTSSLSELNKRAIKMGKKLSERRKESATEISKKITEELQDLNMKGSAVDIIVSHDPNKIGPSGYDSIEIRFAPNKGEPFGVLSKIASGGELSRVTLSIHKVLTNKNEGKTYIFDEVDTGIGGDTGRVVGRKLKEISTSSQVVCITHLAQVASFGSSHHVLTKEDRGNRVITSVYELKSRQERVEEIARMLSGRKNQKEALDHANSLLKDSES